MKTEAKTEGNILISRIFLTTCDRQRRASECGGGEGERERGDGKERVNDGGKGGSMGDCVMTLMKALNPQRTL